MEEFPKRKELASAIRYAHRNSLLIFLIEVWSNSFSFFTEIPPFFFTLFHYMPVLLRETQHRFAR
jgi:hypothetical protein